MKNISINNSIIRSTQKPALKALHAILTTVSSPYYKITLKSLNTFVKEGRTALKSRLAELKDIQASMQPSTGSFTLISESILLSTSLTLTAKGIYMMIKSYATFEGFVITKDYFFKKSGLYFKTYDRAWKELQQAGLLTVSQHRSRTGKFIYTYELAELSAKTEVSPASETATNFEQPTKKTVIELTAEVARLHKALAVRSTRSEPVKKATQLPCGADPKLRRRLPGSETWFERENIPQMCNFSQREYSEDYLNSFALIAGLNC